MGLGGLLEGTRVVLIGEFRAAEGWIGIADRAWVLGLIVHDACKFIDYILMRN